ncbi:MAG TPA: response regulator [Burkholderiales bacterium]|jgi:CheY-like chemotaxis protein|nr:response regulator [Burkholderiales bacterium]
MSPDEERTAHYSGRTKRVLIADDNRDWADGLAVLLEEQGYAVRTAYDGREAIEAARIFQPDIVVLDIRMPRLTGYEAARVFHRHPQSTRPILIAITAWAGESGKLRAEMSGFDYYLAKPAEPAEILELLKNL